MVLLEYSAIIIMDKATWSAQVGFIIKVFVVSILIAIALKTLAPRLSIPETSAVSLAIVLAPTLVLGAFLCWQLWISRHGDSAHPNHH